MYLSFTKPPAEVTGLFANFNKPTTEENLNSLFSFTTEFCLACVDAFANVRYECFGVEVFGKLACKGAKGFQILGSHIQEYVWSFS